jgi:hypothetical protein
VSFFIRWFVLPVLTAVLVTLKLLITLDDVLRLFWSQVLSLLCGATGKSNFFFARLFVSLGAGFYGFMMAVVTVWDFSQASIAFGCLDLVILYNVVRGLRWVWKVAKRLEKGLEGGNLALNLSSGDWHCIFGFRIIGMLLFTVTIVVGEFVGATLLVLIASSLYFLVDFRPGTKSKLRKAAEALSRRVKDFSISTPAPSPT